MFPPVDRPTYVQVPLQSLQGCPARPVALRDYQQDMVVRLHRAWRRERSVMVQMPTGTGKTLVMTAVISEQKGNVLVVAHREELIAQIMTTLTRHGMACRKLRDLKEDTDCRVAVTSIQWLSRNKERVRFSPSLVVIDEAHHALAKTYRMLWDQWPKAKFLGLTATPCRLNGAPFTDLFGRLLTADTIQAFIDKGWLSDFDYVSASPDSRAMRQIRLLKKRGIDGDYQVKEMATVLDVPESIEHLYRIYRQYAAGKKGFVYAIDRTHALHIAQYYGAQGVRCCVIDAQTPAEERRTLVAQYREGTMDIIVNVDIFSEGFDAPEVEFIQLARPTRSLCKYLQQVGRGMRVSEGKDRVVILDQVGLYQTFGLPTVQRDWQRLFLGKEAGTGPQDLTRCVVVEERFDDSTAQRELVNLEMVRIKRAGERQSGLEVFLKDGHYGIMRNGKITCPAKFKRISRLQRETGFFAAATYTGSWKDYNGLVSLVDITTVIDRNGHDLDIHLHGDVHWENGLFCGKMEGYSFYCWDPVGNAYYDTYPDFRTVGGVEIGWTHEHDRSLSSCNRLRYSTGRVSPRFLLHEMFYNRYVVIARDYLVVKRDRNHSYRIRAFLDDTILVDSDEGQGYQQFFLTGKKGALFTQLPHTARRQPDFHRLGLERAVER